MNVSPYDNKKTPSSSSSTPSGKGSSETQNNQKPFQLPSRKESAKQKDKQEAQEDEEQPIKKKGLFDLTMEDIGVKTKQQALEEGAEASTELPEIQNISPAEAVTQVQQIGQLIQKMVDTMAVGQIGGKEFATLDLKASNDVPTAFAGANLTISYENNGITIQFDNFMSPQHQNNAILLVEKNKEQLQQMVESLNAKNIQITELMIGSHVVAVPRPEGKPAPFEPITPAETERGRERRDQGDHNEGNQQGQQGPG